MKSKLAVIGGCRTPQAKAFGKLSRFSAVELGVAAVEAALRKSNLQPEQLDEVVFGNVAGPPDAANIARVIALQAGVPFTRVAHTVNRNCASGMEAIIAAWHAIDEGRAALVLAGGTESMSKIPLLVRDSTKEKLLRMARSKSVGARLRTLMSFRRRDFKPIAGVELGLTDPTCGLNMGQTAEVLAQDFGISRQEQDAFAVESHRRAIEASQRCFLSGEISPLSIGERESGIEELKLDIGPRENQSLEQLAKLRPIFKAEGSVTAGNSCPLTDGATALLLAKSPDANRFVDQPLGYVTAYAIAGCDPRRMGLGPVFAMSKLLEQTSMQLSDFDLIEINEAFAAQVLACARACESPAFAREHLNRSTALGTLDMSKVNINGGAIALGHPVGASGARLVLTLARALRERGLHRGLATLCVGGGQGVAMVVESNDH
ncbi:MAG: thiolase family protein [Pirellulaceae bacterium]